MLALATMLSLCSLSSAAQAQDVYLGVGFPGGATLGYATPITPSLGLRGEVATGLSATRDFSQDWISLTGTAKASRSGVFTDWFPFDNGFRVALGVTSNDIQANLASYGGTATINGKTVNIANEKLAVSIKFPTATPYLGIGYGHQNSTQKGIGFYVDLGVMFGQFDTQVNTSLLNKTIGGITITQADIDAQTQSMRNNLGNVNMIPSVSAGLTFRF